MGFVISIQNYFVMHLLVSSSLDRQIDITETLENRIKWILTLL